MSTLRRQPVSRPKVALGVVAGLCVLAAIVLMAEWLRPGAGLPTSSITPELDADPRVAITCEAPPPREGLREAAPRQRVAEEVTSSELYDCPTVWDGRPVRFTGEVIGGILQRGEESWLQLNDDAYAGGTGPLPYHRDFRGGNGGVGVLVPTRLVGSIRHVGGPAAHGDVLEVTGVFHRVDRETGEIAIVRAATLRVVRPGGPVRQVVEPRRVAVASVLGALAVALMVLQWHRRRRG